MSLSHHPEQDDVPWWMGRKPVCCGVHTQDLTFSTFAFLVICGFGSHLKAFFQGLWFLLTFWVQSFENSVDRMPQTPSSPICTDCWTGPLDCWENLSFYEALGGMEVIMGNHQVQLLPSNDWGTLTGSLGEVHHWSHGVLPKKMSPLSLIGEQVYDYEQFPLIFSHKTMSQYLRRLCCLFHNLCHRSVQE
jgi:hypothetical protein